MVVVYNSSSLLASHLILQIYGVKPINYSDDKKRSLSGSPDTYYIRGVFQFSMCVFMFTIEIGFSLQDSQ